MLQPSEYSVFYGGDTLIQLGLPWQSYFCQYLDTENSTWSNRSFITETPSIFYIIYLYIRLVVTLWFASLIINKDNFYWTRSPVFNDNTPISPHSYHLKLQPHSRQTAQHISWSQGHSTSSLISESIVQTSTLVWTVPDSILRLPSLLSLLSSFAC